MEKRLTRAHEPSNDLLLMDAQRQNDRVENELRMLGTPPMTKPITFRPQQPILEERNFCIHMQVFQPFFVKSSFSQLPRGMHIPKREVCNESSRPLDKIIPKGLCYGFHLVECKPLPLPPLGNRPSHPTRPLAPNRETYAF